MVNENTEAQVKAQIIERINGYKQEAIGYGFDYPTQPIESATLEEILSFYEEIVEYVGYERGYYSASWDNGSDVSY